MKIPTTAGQKLERILYILPAAAREGGVPLHELAATLEVQPKDVLREIEEATARIYFHPAATVEPFTIMVEADRVDVRTHRHFNRPVRLNNREALALGMGLRVLAAETSEPRRTEVMQLAARLEASLRVPESNGPARQNTAEDGVEYVAHDVSVWPGDDSLRGLIAEAIDVRRICEIWYLKPGSSAPAKRRIAAHRLICSKGVWYAAAVDLDRDGLRFFRVDRIIDGSITDEPAPPVTPVDEEVLRNAPYVAVDEVEVTVFYEKQGEEVVHRVADMGWLVRHIMQHGGAAVVKSPEYVRRHIAQVLLAGPARTGGEISA